ncbi:Retrotransposon gag domain - like 10 [Theobroma cacao]|nr:Retrotransposon gag domain - like 10 [Theobroma cacao]
MSVNQDVAAIVMDPMEVPGRHRHGKLRYILPSYERHGGYLLRSSCLLDVDAHLSLDQSRMEEVVLNIVARSCIRGIGCLGSGWLSSSCCSSSRSFSATTTTSYFTTAKDWIIQELETLNDMRLEDDMKLMVATRLLEKKARTWWNSVKSHFTTPPTWLDFLREFDGQYYTHFHQKEKNREFLSLKQRSLTIEEYEARFNKLMSYVPNLVKTEQDQANYFEEGLRNEIKDRMTVMGKELYKEVVQIALRAEKLGTEYRRIQVEFAKRRNLNTSFSQPSKKGKDSFASRSATTASVAYTRPSSQQQQ